jgi:hypothetical protein
LAVAILIVGLHANSSAQKLPPPARTVFKCESDGKIYYSDSPCLGAKKLEIEPTRGADTLSGKKRVGDDVRHEEFREGLAEALRPLTGIDAKQAEVVTRRLKLTEAARAECAHLDVAIQQSEAEERRATTESIVSVQARLYMQRGRFRQLGC